MAPTPIIQLVLPLYSRIKTTMNIFKQLTSWKYRLFTRKIRDVQVAMAETEFKVAKARQIREGVRQDRDRAAQAVFNINTVLEKEADKDKREQLQKELNVNTENMKRYEAQMEMVDKQINGFSGSPEAEPVIGEMEKLASYAELLKMYRQYRETI